jgi:curved DNA-binding protein CbpA
MKNNQSENLYEILNLKPEASVSDIKKSFRKLSVKYHPDKFDKSLSQEEQEIALKKYELITLAHTILTNDATRKEYDQMFYVEKRNEDFFSIKKNFKKYEPIKPEKKDFDVYNKELIEMRHKDLENSYRPRTLDEYNSARENQLKGLEINGGNLNTPVEKQIIEKLTPKAILPANMGNYQNINNVGNMFCEDETNMLDTFTIENIDTNVKINEVDKSLKDYLEQTEKLSKIEPNEFDDKGHLILDKIIQFE